MERHEHAAPPDATLGVLVDAIAAQVSAKVKAELLAQMHEAPRVQPALLSVKDAAVYLGRSEQAIQHLIFDLSLSPGLSDYLQSKIPWREAIQSTKIPNLDLLPRGKVPSSAGDLLLTAAIDDLVQESLDEYDMVLWDTTPLFAAHDAANLCSRVDGILFVARVRHTTVNTMRTALEDLSKRNAKILGIVLNAVKPNQAGYHHKYRYREYFSTTTSA